MTRELTVAAIQTAYGEDLDANIRKTAALIREAAGLGAQVILPSELFQGPYFCVAQEERWFAQAHPWREHPCVTALAPLAGRVHAAKIHWQDHIFRDGQGRQQLEELEHHPYMRSAPDR